MKTVKVKVYQYNELSEKAQGKARQWFAECVFDYQWWDCIYEDAATIGLKITSFDLDRSRHAEGEFVLEANEVAQNVFNNHVADCETYKTARAFMDEWQPVFDAYMDENGEHYESRESEEKMLELEDEFLKSLLEDYSMMLQQESEYMLSEEYLAEGIMANEYEFTEDGARFRG